MHHAHQRGILHRDLKPSNILLDEAGDPHVSDFGLAKSVESSVDLTLSGAALGTPGYMAPEQAAGDSKGVTTAADIFSLGAILYELLTGCRPFEGNTPLAALRKTIEEDPRLPSAYREVDRDLETICLKCLAKAPVNRYPSADAFGDDLRRWLRGEPISARPPTRGERLLNQIRLRPIRAALIGLAALMLLLAATGLYASYRTYVFLVRRVVSEQHLVIPPQCDAVYHLSLFDHDLPPRCTVNFWKHPFMKSRHDPVGRYARIEFTDIPAELASEMQVQVFADIPVFAEPPKTPPLTNGQTFIISGAEGIERAYYLQEVNFQTSNVLARATNPGVRIILLGRPGDNDPYQPAGKLAGHERY